MADSKKKKVLLGRGVVGLAIVGIILLTKKAAARSVELKEGWNEVKYEGPSQKVEEAVKSIETYLITVYYWSGLYNQWMQLVRGSWVEPNMLLNIEVREDCTWTY